MSISNSDDVIDSREVIERIRELEEEREDLADTHAEALAEREENQDPDEAESLQERVSQSLADLEEWDNENGAELAVLQSLQEEAEGYADGWRHGATLIRDSYFEDYARELADDIGAVDPNATWPQTCIDWKQAARELKQDYTEVDFGGVTYWAR